MTPLHLPLPWPPPNLVFPTPVRGSCSLAATPASLGLHPSALSQSPPHHPALHSSMSQLPALLHFRLPLSVSGKTQPGPVLSSLCPHLSTQPFIHCAAPLPTHAPSHPVSHHPQGHLSQKRLSWWPPTSHPLTSTQTSILPTLFPKPTWMPRGGFQGLPSRLRSPPHLESCRGSSRDGRSALQTCPASLPGHGSHPAAPNVEHHRPAQVSFLALGGLDTPCPSAGLQSRAGWVGATGGLPSGGGG